MIVSTNNDSPEIEFEKLLALSTQDLIEIAERDPHYFLARQGVALEDDLADSLTRKAKGSVFENTIQKYSAFKFPDIVVKKYFGVEVKTTEKNHWVTTGNSVLENTRVEGVNRIYLFFGKLSSPVGFKWKNYDKCMREVVVTHSPRYLIDMNLRETDTIFMKIGVSYDELRQSINPIKPIVDYYRSKLQPGEDMWWIDNENRAATEINSTNFVLKPWSSLSLEKRMEISCTMMIYFPEIFSASQTKFYRPSSWLVTRHSIIHPNLRDTFTAGGRDFLPNPFNGLGRIPRILIKVFDNLDLIFHLLSILPREDLIYYWGGRNLEQDILTQWINIFMANANHLLENPSRFKSILLQKKDQFTG